MRRSVPYLLVVGFLVCRSPAEAASFACSKALGESERAICSDPVLSRLDERLNQDYVAAARALDPLGQEFLAPLRESQRRWLDDRDGCGKAVPCLRHQYERRISVLLFGPDSDASRPVDKFVGRFTDGHHFGYRQRSRAGTVTRQ